MLLPQPLDVGGQQPRLHPARKKERQSTPWAWIEGVCTLQSWAPTQGSSSRNGWQHQPLWRWACMKRACMGGGSTARFNLKHCPLSLLAHGLAWREQAAAAHQVVPQPQHDTFD